jgi:hypothetical protein
MLRLELTDEQAAMLRGLLESKWEEVVKEVRHTDHRDFKLLLKAKADMLESLLAQLATVGVPVR